MASRRFFRQLIHLRLLIVAPVALWCLSASMVAAEGSGLSVTVYDNLGWNDAPPLPSDEQIVGQTAMSQIDWSFDNSPLFGMTEDFVVRFDGWLISPCWCEVRFAIYADDGTKLILGGQTLTDDWFDKGGGGSTSEPVQMLADQAMPITVWFYENGGGAWIQAWWEVNGEWSIIPASAFSMSAPASTTTTTTTTSTTTTSTTIPQTTSTSTTSTTTTEPASIPPPSTTALESTTTPATQPASTTSTTSISPQTTTIPAPTTTRTSLPVPPAASTTSAVETTTTTTTLLESTTSVSPSPATIPVAVDQTGRGMKPARLISRALRKGVSAGQQRAVVAGAVLIAMPSAFRPSRKQGKIR